ncbi:hypothetical protein [Actinosynnema sp. NPDC023587]|uniref:hypothetical protein n=1 Tax=Actinosynnema sp. NPDC023587 TaxID=3154695 RepID=UPI0033C997BC
MDDRTAITLYAVLLTRWHLGSGARVTEPLPVGGTSPCQRSATISRLGWAEWVVHWAVRTPCRSELRGSAERGRATPVRQVELGRGDGWARCPRGIAALRLGRAGRALAEPARWGAATSAAEVPGFAHRSPGQRLDLRADLAELVGAVPDRAEPSRSTPAAVWAPPAGRSEKQSEIPPEELTHSGLSRNSADDRRRAPRW